MARPQKNTVDYFPHPVTHGKKMSYLEKKYKNDGYAVWFKILEELGKADNHYLNLSDEVQMMFLSDRCLVSEKLLVDIIEDLIRLREFDKDLWNENCILFNQKFNESIKDAYKKRTNPIISKNSLLILLNGLGIRKLGKSELKQGKSKSQGGEKPQTKVKKNKVNKTREKRAVEFLISEKQIEYDDFEMQNKKLVDDWNSLIDNFNDKIDIEIAQSKIEWDADQLLPRLRSYTRSWISNQSNRSSHKNQQSGTAQRVEKRDYF